jgi:hypothetical protein
MKTQQMVWLSQSGWQSRGGSVETPQLVLFFSYSSGLEDPVISNQLREFFPAAIIAGCSTGGEILGPEIYDQSVVATAIEFEHSTVKTACARISVVTESFNCGKSLAEELNYADLRAIFVLSDGLVVNGTELANGINSVCSSNVAVIGGLAGDGANFSVTKAGLNGEYSSGVLVGIGLYGDRLNICHGSKGGWDSFGPMRKVTKSDKNVLFELDGEPALDLYKRYLGEESKHLPSSALLFPLSLERQGELHKGQLVRTILGIDENHKSMTFAGDIPEGSSVRLMRANLDRIIQAAGTAALDASDGGKAQLALLVSCIGRKLVLGQRTVEEVEAVCEALGSNCAVMGFYSYGELCPLEQGGYSELHNQTMTISTISEGN